jgi:serine/threonine protein phosphatase 1
VSGAFRRVFALRGRASREPPNLPPGLRVYAVGDIHGRYDLLEAIAAEIGRDLTAAPPQRSVEIFLGDYIDRGPQSRDVLEWMVSSPLLADERICLLGNHEDMLLQVIADSEATWQWLQNGGLATLLSYDAISPDALAELTVAEARAAFLAAFPTAHRAFVEGLPRLKRIGGYVFVHAGLRPGRAIEDQDPDDLVWIRDAFLFSRADFGACVVHGHTPADRPEVLPNRINLDTGAFFTGRLTCLVLEGDTRRFLQTEPD